ncbi:phosphopantetheine-binding protein [Solwaraspora sp. WMMD406]|uniref:phosphopantetheine-binding protein n=1 Tax=Solwaraspora sp. WMMD406 TaxID=3016095 RepID=UPI002415EFE8|nr:phosphopantetheine-binding protein [Solwaraspora sp. WMMD406]MDG4766919.1 phosphopantetheine-binding protein [Solwaraspora sp. WMMD406]
MDRDPADLYATIGRVMGQILVRPALGADEDFFKNGGDSLRAVELLQRLAAEDGYSEHLGRPEVQAAMLERVFEKATPRALASAAFAEAG